MLVAAVPVGFVYWDGRLVGGGEEKRVGVRTMTIKLRYSAFATMPRPDSSLGKSRLTLFLSQTDPISLSGSKANT